MDFLNNLSEHIGGARGGFSALGEMLATMALGAANPRPGEHGSAAIARGFAAGAAGLRDSFERGRSDRDRYRMRSMAAEKLKDPELGEAERDLYEAVASGNTAALELFDETLAARGSDRADRAEDAKLAYYNAKLGALGAADALTPDQVAHNFKVVEARKRMAENPGLFDQMDLGDPDSLTGQAMQTLKGLPDPEGPAFHKWLATDALERPPLESLLDDIGSQYGAEGLSHFQSRYGVGGVGARETRGAAAETADTPQGGGAGGVVESVLEKAGAANRSGFAGNLRGLIDSAFGTDFSAGDRQRSAAQGEMGSLLDELDAAARGESYTPVPPRAPASPALIPESQLDSTFDAITGGAGGSSRIGPDLMSREDSLRRTTGPSSRFDAIVGQVFPQRATGPGYRGLQGRYAPMAPEGDMVTRGSAIGEVRRPLVEDILNAISMGPSSTGGSTPAPGYRGLQGRPPARWLDPDRRPVLGQSPGLTPDPAYQAGVKAREDFLRALGWGE